jgi:DNA replication and repair protein RecF
LSHRGGDSSHSATDLSHSAADLPSPAADLEKLYLQKLLDRRKAAIFQAKTITGPHRDDLIFFINDQNILNSASRGEFRTLLLALKMAEIDFIREKTGYSPLLLLDDVFSELDEKRRLSLFSAIDGCQTIISTTDAENLKS